MQSKAKTVAAYLAELAPDRRHAISTLRNLILKNLPAGYEEGIQWGFISYFVPHSVYPAGYHCQPHEPVPFTALGSQKKHMALYGMGIYMDSAQQKWFVNAWKKSGRKLDMGKSCVRFKKLEDVPLEVVAEAVRRVPMKKFLEVYEQAIAMTAAGRKAAGCKPAKRKAKKA